MRFGDVGGKIAACTEPGMRNVARKLPAEKLERLLVPPVHVSHWCNSVKSPDHERSGVALVLWGIQGPGPVPFPAKAVSRSKPECLG